MILHADFFVRSMDSALGFYCEKLGFSVVDDAMLRGAAARLLSNGRYNALRLILLKVNDIGAMLELVEFQLDSALSADAAIPRRKGWISILVDDLDELIDRLLTKALSPASQVLEVHLPKIGSSRIVFYTDPDDNGIEFVQIQTAKHAKRAVDFTV